MCKKRAIRFNAIFQMECIQPNIAESFEVCINDLVFFYQKAAVLVAVYIMNLGDNRKIKMCIVVNISIK